MYKVSRLWNKIAYCLIGIGQKMIWDYTGKNSWLKSDEEVARKFSKDIFTTL